MAMSKEMHEKEHYNIRELMKAHNKSIDKLINCLDIISATSKIDEEIMDNLLAKIKKLEGLSNEQR